MAILPAGIGLYFLRCEFHVLAPVLPICGNWSGMESLVLVPVFALAQLYVAAVLCLSILPYLDVLIALIVFGNYTVRELM
jgi:hypothetical protein